MKVFEIPEQYNQYERLSYKCQGECNSYMETQGHKEGI